MQRLLFGLIILRLLGTNYPVLSEEPDNGFLTVSETELSIIIQEEIDLVVDEAVKVATVEKQRTIVKIKRVNTILILTIIGLVLKDLCLVFLLR